MELRFWIDPETDLPHVFNHGVTEEEVRQVMARPAEEIPAEIARGFASVRRWPAAICKWFTCRMRNGRVPSS
jgi:hypothetical protein